MSSKGSSETHKFPDNFIWAVATSAFQIEGATRDDGRGPSIWDTYCKAGYCRNQDADVACNSYYNWKRDIEMIKELGCKEYRFSISWSRILPDGTTRLINQKGVEYYRKLIEGLVKEGIEPMVTLFHWDLPQALQDRGGFLNSEIINHFAEFSKFCFEQYGDLVKKWITINEPIAFMSLGYGAWDWTPHAPGGFKDYSEWTFYLASHHLLLAHSKAVKVYRENFKDQNGKIGLGLVLNNFYPKDETDKADVEAADIMREFSLGFYSNPVIYGDYPEIVKRRVWEVSQRQGRVVSRLPEFTEDEKNELKNSVDFFGVNYYCSFHVKAFDGDGCDLFKGDIRSIDMKGKITEMIKNYPKGLRDSLLYLKNTYGDIPLMITENGVKDPENMKSYLDDDERIDFLKNHLIAVSESINIDKVNVIGYTAWSLMDNFEWTEGYGERYGLYYVDFNDPQRTRTPKKSAFYYRDVIAANRVE